MAATDDSTRQRTSSESRSESSLSSATPLSSDSDTIASKIERKKDISSSDNSDTSISLKSLTINQTDSSSAADVPSDALVNDDKRQPEPHQVHGHKLPTGWACNYDPETDEYDFELVNQSKMTSLLGTTVHDHGINVPSPTQDHDVQTSRRPTLCLYQCQYGYHFPSSPTASMISELARQVQKSGVPGTAGAKKPNDRSRQIGYGKTKLFVPSDEEEQSRRLRDMFPTATEPVIEQMIRIYHGREGLIKAALISLGYKRSSEYDARQTTSQSPVMLMMSKQSSKKMFEKLVSYFPDRDENLIKSLMYKHKEVEYEVISALVESGQQDKSPVEKQPRPDKAAPVQDGKNGAIMKLRYLKTLYPTCEEIELYHLLHCNDLNVEKVMEIVERRGHKRNNIEQLMQNRKSIAQKMRAQQAAQASQVKSSTAAQEFVEAHRKRARPTFSASRIEDLKISLKKSFENVHDGLILAALESADYNEGLAKKFLSEMENFEESLLAQRYQLPQEIEPDVVTFPCKATQKGNENCISMVPNEHVMIPREIVECDHALALLKVDAATYTEEDFPKIRFTHRKGKQQDLRVGTQYADAIRDRLTKAKQRRAHPHVCQKLGSHYKEICNDSTRPKPNSRAVGRNPCLVQGTNASLNAGHNPVLLKRIHPFFREKKFSH